jgi:hypothetical protein
MIWIAMGIGRTGGKVVRDQAPRAVAPDSRSCGIAAISKFLATV